MKKPFFSVIVPEHNSAEFMRKGLESIRAQTFADYELIVICDCEEDFAIAKEYTDKAVLTDQKRCGPKRNIGLDMAAGKWILFMDDDDWFLHDGAFQVIADHVGKEDILAFGFEWAGVGPARNTPGNLMVAIWNKAWKRSFIEKNNLRFPGWEHSDDLGFADQAHPLAKVAFLDESLYYYNYLRPGSIAWKLQNGELDTRIPGR